MGGCVSADSGAKDENQQQQHDIKKQTSNGNPFPPDGTRTPLDGGATAASSSHSYEVLQRGSGHASSSKLIIEERALTAKDPTTSVEDQPRSQGSKGNALGSSSTEDNKLLKLNTNNLSHHTPNSPIAISAMSPKGSQEKKSLPVVAEEEAQGKGLKLSTIELGFSDPVGSGRLSAASKGKDKILLNNPDCSVKQLQALVSQHLQLVGSPSSNLKKLRPGSSPSSSRVGGSSSRFKQSLNDEEHEVTPSSSSWGQQPSSNHRKAVLTGIQEQIQLASASLKVKNVDLDAPCPQSREDMMSQILQVEQKMQRKLERLKSRDNSMKQLPGDGNSG